MAAILKAESTLTDRYQTTVPEPVRRALGLERRDKIKYTISASGEVILSRADSAEGNDPVLGEFLRFLAHDIAKAPESLRLIDAQLVQHLRALTKDVDVDLDAPLSPDDE
jgi:antitoxin PrlF